MLRPAARQCSASCRQLSTSARASSKASKARAKLPKIRQPVRANPAAAQMIQDARGTGIGADPRLYEPEEVAPTNTLDTTAATNQVEPRDLERDMLESQSTDSADAGHKVIDEKLRGTGVAASERAYDSKQVDPTKQPAPSASTSTKDKHSSEEELIYTANAPYNVPLLLSAAFVFAVLSLSAADMARVGYSSYNEEKGEYEIAPKWKRYSIATGFGLVSVGIVSWGALAPARLVTQITMKRPASVPATVAFPRDAVLTLHSPVTKLPGLGPRRVKLSQIQLLGPLADGPRSYHPKSLPSTPQRNDALSRMYRKARDTIFISTSSVKKSPWTRKGGFSHSPFLIINDRTSYSLAIKRGVTGQPYDPKGAWCKDWDGFEKALLNVQPK
ncbi:hypothetical protein OIV83_000124 [Microbotryomycetes sp. JL201]|nr:hypothetical protein OIV83_000124 [Microbotryomycetes sp. JL201]